jgi:phenylpropionate dioxygenase-like ring-hydroxylating dioxygenase large terminal subunit
MRKGTPGAICANVKRMGAAISDAQTSLPAEAEADAALRKMNCGPYDVAASAPRIVENFLDMAHFSFVHEGWLGLRARPEELDEGLDSTYHGERAYDL